MYAYRLTNDLLFSVKLNNRCPHPKLMFVCLMIVCRFAWFDMTSVLVAMFLADVEKTTIVTTTSLSSTFVVLNYSCFTRLQIQSSLVLRLALNFNVSQFAHVEICDIHVHVHKSLS